LIDLHTHVLPGVDDGARTMDDALAMAKVALDDGITTVVATPHRHEGAYRAPREDAQQRLAELQAALTEADLNLEVVLGGEAQIAPDSAAQVRAGLAFTINGGRYLLVEWPFEQWPLYSEQAIFDLQIEGVLPIIAHAERYRVVQRNHLQLAPLIERGVIVQVNGGSLLGTSGPEVQRTAEKLVLEGMAHVLASDAHSAHARPPLLSAARDRAASLVGEARARAMVEDVPRQIIESRGVSLPDVEVRKARPFWAFWRTS
jgi:protein-tyrosine phosphatase